MIFDEEEITEEILQSARPRQTVGRIDAMVKHQKKIALLTREARQPGRPRCQSEGERPAQDRDGSIAREKV